MTSQSLLMRGMRWTDIPAVHAIEQDAFPDTAWSIETFWSELAAVPETRRYWVAEAHGEVVGYAGLLVAAPESDIQTIAVASEHRGQGMGTQLLTAAMEAARDRGCGHLMLEVAADNASARRLYERHGFETLAKRSNYYGRGRDALVMRARLTSALEESAST
jgi:ribosomal-protein-alanine N-acetyltransferase